MSFVGRIRPAALAVSCALEFGPRPFRLIGLQTHFPDIGRPVPEKVGFLRYPGESIVGDAEPVAAGPASDLTLTNGG